MDEIEEVWAEIPGYSGYLASTAGRVMGPTGKVLSQRPKRKKKNGGKPYLIVEIRAKDVNVHKLVLLAFIGAPPPGLECRHLNDDITDNRLVNLQWGSRFENRIDAFKNGRVKLLSLDKIDYIHNATHLTVRAIAAELGVSKSLVAYIRAGRYWRPELLEVLVDAEMMEPIL